MKSLPNPNPSPNGPGKDEKPTCRRRRSQLLEHFCEAGCFHFTHSWRSQCEPRTTIVIIDVVLNYDHLLFTMIRIKPEH